VFRQSLEQNLQQILKELDVKAFTEDPKVFAIGEASTAFNSMVWRGSNRMILAGMEDEQATRLAARLREFCDRMIEKKHRTKIPLRLFSFPSELLI
jgi:hypothetical protein